MKDQTQWHASPLPELLAPAGSPEALEAALSAGADAVYLGGSRFNARMNAHNFDKRELGEAVTQAHRMGGRIYLTLNTLIFDRELEGAVQAAYEAATAGVDGLIVADLGASALIHKAMPSLALHASTQLSGHNAAMGEVLAPFGFTRFVLAREATLADLDMAVAKSPLEVEVFIHGALCVCHSGQCLFSSVVGGRSGNRGECAQPCRLPYRGAGRGPGEDIWRQGGPQKGQTRRDTAHPSGSSPCGQAGENYPLSLKDLSLACHVPDLLRAGVASLKIEGRMKSAEYVGGVVAVWRRLLDQRRAADRDEMQMLSDLFSRGGFTDGYFTGRVNHTMMGVRSEEDKARTRRAGDRVGAKPQRGEAYLPLRLHFSCRAGEPVTLTATAPLYRQGGEHTVSVTVIGDCPGSRPPDADSADAATINRDTPALDRNVIIRQLARVGGTPYRLSAPVTVDLEDGLRLPLSALNALRRQAVEALDKARAEAMASAAAEATADAQNILSAVPHHAAPCAPQSIRRTARFYRPDQLTPEAEKYFSLCFLPLSCWKAADTTERTIARGVVLPPVLFDRETPAVRDRLARVLAAGARHLTVCNPGHLPMVAELIRQLPSDTPPVVLHGDFRLNAVNAQAVVQLGRLAARTVGQSFADILLSPELTLPQLRDLYRALSGAEIGVPLIQTVVYGRLPLMLLEKCVIRELYTSSADSRLCDGAAGVACALCAQGKAALRDRKGVAFPVLRERPHRNLILNSLPLSMTDRQDELAHAGIFDRHFLFTTESPAAVDAVIRADRQGQSVGGEVRRIQ